MAKTIDILINGRDMTGPAVTSAKAGFASLNTSAEATSGKMTAMAVAAGTALGNMATTAISKLGEMVTSVVTTGFSFNNMKQQADIAFTTMLGSGEKAKAFLDKLQTFAAKTPFEFPDLLMASQRMLAMGFQANQVLPTLTAIGDAVAGLGGSSEMVNRVTTALGQMQAKGKATGEEMMQLTEAGIPAWEFLAKKIGVSIPEAMDMVTKGSVKADVAIGALVDGMNNKFGGLMEKQSATFGGLLSTIKDTFAQISGKVMQPAFDAISAGLKIVVDWTSKPAFTNGLNNIVKMVAKFVEWGEKVMPTLITGFTRFLDWMDKAMEVVKNIVKPIGDAIAKFIKLDDVVAALGILLAGPLLGAFGAVLVGLAQFLAPIAAVVAAVAALRWAWENDFGNIRTFTLNTVQKISDWFFKESGIWKGTWEETWEWIYKRVDRFIRIDIYNAIVGTWAEIKFQWTFHTTKIRDGLVAWSLETLNTIENWRDRAIQFFNIWKDKVVEFFKTTFDPIIKDITDWAIVTESKISVWVGNMTKKFGEWKDDMIERFQAVFDWWGKNVQPWIDKGVAIIQGLWDGMKRTWINLRDWFTGVWGDLTDRFKRFFGIASPSKVFFGYGQNLMEGLGEGIKAYANVPLSYVDSVSNSITAQFERLRGAVVAKIFDINNAASQLNINPALLGTGAGGTGKVVGYGPNGELILEGITNLPKSSNTATPVTATTPTSTLNTAIGGGLIAGATSQSLLGGITLATPDIASAQNSAAAAAAKVKDFIEGLGTFLSETVNSSTTSSVFRTLSRDKENNAIGIVELRAADARMRDEMAKLLGVGDLYGRLGDSIDEVMEKITGGTDLSRVASLLQSAVDFRTLANYYSTSDYGSVLPTDARLTGGNQTTNEFNITLQGSNNASADVLGIVELLGSLMGTASP